MLVGGTKEAINMIEVGARELPEDTIAQAIQKAHEVIQEVVSMIEELQAQVPVEKEATIVELDANLYEKVKAEIHDRLVVLKTITGKQERNNAVNELFDEVRARLRRGGGKRPAGGR